MTGDDHGNNGTAARFNEYLAAARRIARSPTGGASAARRTSTRARRSRTPTVASYVGAGLRDRAARHDRTARTGRRRRCRTSTHAADAVRERVSAARRRRSTNRTHCIVWSDWSTQPQVELSNGIRFDTNYYYWPDTWIHDRPGMFTGSGMPQRFANADRADDRRLSGGDADDRRVGADVPEEHQHAAGQRRSARRATTARSRRTCTPTPSTRSMPARLEPTAIVASAKARNMPVVTAKQMLDWLDGRNGSSFQIIAWSGNVLRFTVAVAAGANGLQAMVPATAGSSPITGVQLNGSTVHVHHARRSRAFSTRSSRRPPAHIRSATGRTHSRQPSPELALRQRRHRQS